eukprot:1454222-Alexandrium_andersonii.AAC.1
MSASLVGSEMCIRDRLPKLLIRVIPADHAFILGQGGTLNEFLSEEDSGCLLYTSDAADDM